MDLVVREDEQQSKIQDTPITTNQGLLMKRLNSLCPQRPKIGVGKGKGLGLGWVGVHGQGPCVG